MCHTPIVIRATRALFQRFDDEKYPWNRSRHVRLMLIGASAHPMAAFSGFYESHKHPPSGNVCGIVPPHRDGHWNGHQSVYILHLSFVCCCPGGHWGDMEPVVTRWWRPVASVEALVMLHRAMLHVLLQRLHTAIKMACDREAFVCHCRVFWLA